MRRSFVSRIAAVALASLVGISSTGLAVAHDYAHEEAGATAAHDQASAHDLADGPVAADLPPAEGHASGPAVTGTGDHAHPQLARAQSARMDASIVMAAMVPADVPTDIAFVGTAAALLTAAPAAPTPARARPRQPRAPPIG